MANSKQVVCHHILAVDQKFPSSEILKKMKNYLQNETINQRNKRLNDPSDGTKPGTHRRRRGNANSRNGKNEKIIEYIDLQNDFPGSAIHTATIAKGTKRAAAKLQSQKDTAFPDPPCKKQRIEPEVICLSFSSNKSRLPQVPFRLPQMNPQIVRVAHNNPDPTIFRPIHLRHINPPRIVMPRQSASVIRNVRPQRLPLGNFNVVQPLPLLQNQNVKHIIDNYRTNSNLLLPDYLSYHPFIITKVGKLSGWKNRRCAHNECKAPLGDNSESIVITHVESYNYIDPEKGTPKKTLGARAICPTMLCMNRRYPFITKECFISELNAEDTEKILENILRK